MEGWQIFIISAILFLGGIFYKMIWDSINNKPLFYYKISWLDKQTGKPEVEYVVLKKEMTVSTYKKIISKLNEFPNLKSGGIIEPIKVESTTDYDLYSKVW